MAAGSAAADRLVGKMAGKLLQQAGGALGVTKLLGRARDNLLSSAKDPRLRDAINELFRDKARVGNGSSMDAVRYERATGKLLSPKGHIPKLVLRRAQLMSLLRDPSLSPSDKQIAKDLLIDIQNALQ